MMNPLCKLAVRDSGLTDRVDKEHSAKVVEAVDIRARVARRVSRVSWESSATIAMDEDISLGIAASRKRVVTKVAAIETNL